MVGRYATIDHATGAGAFYSAALTWDGTGNLVAPGQPRPRARHHLRVRRPQPPDERHHRGGPRPHLHLRRRRQPDREVGCRRVHLRRQRRAHDLPDRRRGRRVHLHRAGPDGADTLGHAVIRSARPARFDRRADDRELHLRLRRAAGVRELHQGRSDEHAAHARPALRNRGRHARAVPVRRRARGRSRDRRRRPHLPPRGPPREHREGHRHHRSGCVDSIRYDPFGAVASRTPADATTPIGFAHGELDAAIGLLYLQARYYHPVYGRFISADPIVQDVFDPSAWNAYAYCRNNPQSYIDPTGRDWWQILVGALAVVAIVALVVLSVVTFGATTPLLVVGIGLVAGGIVGGIAAAQAGGDAGDILLGRARRGRRRRLGVVRRDLRRRRRRDGARDQGNAAGSGHGRSGQRGDQRRRHRLRGRVRRGPHDARQDPREGRARRPGRCRRRRRARWSLLHLVELAKPDASRRGSRRRRRCRRHRRPLAPPVVCLRASPRPSLARPRSAASRGRSGRPAKGWR